MEKNSNIFPAGGDALVYLAGPMHKKYSTTFVGAIHLVRTYLRTTFSVLTLHRSVQLKLNSQIEPKTNEGKCEEKRHNVMPTMQ